MTDQFEVQSQNFLAEFKSQASSTFHPNLHLQDLRVRGRGRGIIALADIPADTELFTIPRDYVISVENSDLYRSHPELFEDINDDDDDNNNVPIQEKIGSEGDVDDSLLPKPWLDLILVLIHDYLHRDTSNWKAYWDVLPQSFDTLMFWSSSELAELQASSVRGRIGKESADRMFQSRIIPVVEKHSGLFYTGTSNDALSRDALLDLCHRMGSLIMAYAFDLQSSGDENNEDGDEENEDGWAEDKDAQTAMGMVPMADMLNADAEFNAHLEHGDDSLTMRSLREIKKGEEVLNYYGPLGNGDLARRYGYTSDLHARYDVVELSWSLIRDVMTQHFQKEISELSVFMDEDEMEEAFVLERETGDPDETGKLTSRAKFTAFPEELVDQITAFAASALSLKSRDKLADSEKRKLKQIFLQIIAKVLDDRLNQDPTTLDQDKELLAKSETCGRRRMAIVVRSGEKQLLQEAKLLVDELKCKYEVAESEIRNGDGPPQKKRKTKA